MDSVIIDKLIVLFQLTATGISLGFGGFIVYTWSREIKAKTNISSNVKSEEF